MKLGCASLFQFFFKEKCRAESSPDEQTLAGACYGIVQWVPVGRFYRYFATVSTLDARHMGTIVTGAGIEDARLDSGSEL
jgi:hypothetical protein